VVMTQTLVLTQLYVYPWRLGQKQHATDVQSQVVEIYQVQGLCSGCDVTGGELVEECRMITDPIVAH
jgi:hypothetical protein